ncbi:MAG TPA: FAD-dependent oxidoreductase [Devosia sp.]|nr:FAD-dependent oxidoreductase [Devosia sp.]
MGAGPAGLAAAIAARDAGASVIIIDCNTDIGGHGMLSGGAIELGGGHSLQQALGISDSAEHIFADHIRSDIVQGRYNDRDLVRVFADESAATFEFLVENGVEMIPARADTLDRVQVGHASVPRVFKCREWPVEAETAAPHRNRNGSGLVRSLARSATAKGAVVRLRHRLQRLLRESQRVAGLVAEGPEGDVTLQANSGIVLATGGSTGNVNLRRVFDPRLTEVYQEAGAAYSSQTGDSELAAMAVGASLWATANQTSGAGVTIAKTMHIGCRWGYRPLVAEPASVLFDKARATGLTVKSWRDMILVTAAGERFWNEEEDSADFINAALAYHGDPHELNGGGPIWAIFDAAMAARESWITAPPYVDPQGYFIRGETLAELAANIRNPYQHVPMEPARLEQTIARYNRFVAQGRDEDFGKAGLTYPIAKPPFFAAWATPILHDTLSGLRIDRTANVMDINGRPIAGLYCAGEAQGGLALHGLARCLVFGRIAGRSAATRR